MKNIKHLFPITKKYIYFQSAGMSPITVFNYKSFLNNYKEYLLSADINWEKDFQKLNELKHRIGKMINCEGENINFLENNSLAMSLIGLMLKEKYKHFNIVSFEEEFPSNTVPFEYLGIEMRYVRHKNHRYLNEDILSMCDKNTKAIVISYVQYCTGYRHNLKELGKILKDRNILFIVNATQAFPIFNIDMKEMNIDILTCSFHKWTFCAHIGTMIAFNSNFFNNFRSPIAGWLSVDTSNSNDFIHTGKNVPFNLYKNANQFTFGSSNIKNKLILNRTFDFIDNYGSKNIIKRIFDLSDYLIKKLKKFQNVEIISPIARYNERSAILAINLIDKKNKDFVEYLKKYKIITALRNNYVRISLNIFNTNYEIDVFINCLALFLSKNK
ncbi:MAG: aminotransferase class V-fold PLP-dependent enzyme [Bacteroidales bacterium]|nr:aminotransferase class V-fold PLP-dependent enzyme [Bacteroidales bacterium]